MTGSILAGTAEHRLLAMETHLEVEADQDPEVVRSIVAQAERMCFVLDAIERTHEVVRRSSLNGAPLQPSPT